MNVTGKLLQCLSKPDVTLAESWISLGHFKLQYVLNLGGKKEKRKGRFRGLENSIFIVKLCNLAGFLDWRSNRGYSLVMT